jgi:RHS repeat-associated protein
MPSRSFSASSYRYGFGGHEKVDEVSGSGNTVDMGDRWLDVRLGRTPSIDSKAGKYPGISPYAYAVNSPLSVIDPDGNDVYLITVPTSYKSPGHTYLAVDNYKQIKEDVVDKAGKVLQKKGDWVPDGTVTVYSFGPTQDVFNVTDLDKNIKGNVKSFVRKKEDIVAGRLLPTDKSTFGVVSIETSKTTDDAAKTKLEAFKAKVNKPGATEYNACNNNCSDMAADVINDLDGFKDVTGNEHVAPDFYGAPQKIITTPNFLLDEVAKKVGTDKTKGTVHIKTSKKDFVEKYTGGKFKDKTPGK